MLLHAFVYLVKIYMAYLASFFVIIKSIVVARGVNFGAKVTKSMYLLICGALHDLVPPVQFKKREKHPWRSVTFSKVAGFSLQLY